MKQKTSYKCKDCGQVFSKWQGQCTNCEGWNTLYEFNETDVNIKNQSNMIKQQFLNKSIGSSRMPQKVNEIKITEESRIVTSFPEFNRVLGGGIVTDSISVISSPPGMGKSTLLGEIANDIAKQGKKVLYISGEESKNQITSRLKRTIKDISNNFYLESEQNMDTNIEYIKGLEPDLIILDSIQMVYTPSLPNRIGSIVQVSCCSEALHTIAKQCGIAVIMVAHVTKENELSGPKYFEHMVDTVLTLDGTDTDSLRILSSTKNRFGSTDEIGLFQMSDKGMKEVENPSEYFMTKRDCGVVGSALTVSLEGSRPLVVEIESLVSQAFNNISTVTTENFKRDQIKILAAILDQRTQINTMDKNLFIKVTGGLKIKENAINLGIIASLISSCVKLKLTNDMIFIGDIGLTGETKNVPYLEKRVKEVDRLGFSHIIIPDVEIETKTKGQVIKVRNIIELISVMQKLAKK